MADSITVDELADYLSAFADRHQITEPDTLRFMFIVAEELQELAPERLALIAHSLDAYNTLRNEFYHSSFDRFSSARIKLNEVGHASATVSASASSEKTAVFLAILRSAARMGERSPDRDTTARSRGWSMGRGSFSVRADFDDPLPEDIQAAFEA